MSFSESDREPISHSGVQGYDMAPMPLAAVPLVPTDPFILYAYPTEMVLKMDLNNDYDVVMIHVVEN
jgi:hypothetical protein